MNIGTMLDVSLVKRGSDPRDPYPEVRRKLEGNSDRNAFDPEVLTYPSTVVLEIPEMGVMPVQNAAFLESVALDGNLSPMEAGNAMLNLVGAALRLAIHIGVREAYTLATDATTAKAAIASGWELLPYRVLRRRLRVDDEGKLL